MTSRGKAALWMGLPLLAAAISLIDPWFSRYLMPELSRATFNGWQLPILSAALLGTSLVLLAARYAYGLAADFASRAMALLLMASQLNGLRIGPIDVFDLALFTVLTLWLAKLALDTTRPLRVSALFLLASVLFLLGVAHLSLMSPLPWAIGVFGIARVAIVALVVVDLCRDLRTIEAVTRTFVLIAVASASLGIVQFALAYLQVFQFTLIVPADTAFKPTPLGFVMRASGLCVTAQHFSSFLAYALPFALWRAFDLRRWRDGVAILILLAGIGVSLNFGAMLAALLMIGVVPFLRWPSLSIHLGMGLVGLVALAYFVGLLDVAYELSFGDAGVSKGVDQRKTLFALGLEQFGRNPWVGTGLRGFGSVDGNFWDRPVHNLLGQAAVELGVVGLLTVLAIFYFLTMDLAKLAAQLDEAGKQARIGLLLVLIAFLLGQSEPNLDQSNLWIVLALAQAIVLSARKATITG
jgi:O-antigen ligase